jgi:hypothetical protein
MNAKCNKKAFARRGQLMIISLIILAGVLGIGLTAGTLFLREMSLARQTLDSVKAVYAAETALEWQLYQYLVGNPVRVTPVSARASASAPGSDPFFAIDGNPATAWEAGNFPVQWIEVNLGAAIEFRRIRLLVSQLPDGDTTHNIYVGDNPANLSLVHQFQGFTSNSSWIEWTASPAIPNARFVRIETTASPSWVSWFEVEIYEDGPALSPPVMLNNTSFTSQVVTNGPVRNINAIGVSRGVRRGFTVEIPL